MKKAKAKATAKTRTKRAAAEPARRGRRDPERTRAALLAAAIAEFAQKGLAGARVDEIAARARVNKQLVYHHFGNKNDLFRVALEEVYRRIRAEELALHLGDLAPKAAMERLVVFTFDYLAAHPEFIAMLNDENRHGAVHVAASKDVRALNFPVVKLIGTTLESGVADGVFRADMDPVDVYISIAGLVYFFFSNHRTLSAIFGRDLSAPRSVAARRRHVVRFVLSALAPDKNVPAQIV